MRILQERILEWVTYPFSRGSSRPKDQTHVSGIAGSFTSWATKEAYSHCCKQSLENQGQIGAENKLTEDLGPVPYRRLPPSPPIPSPKPGLEFMWPLSPGQSFGASRGTRHHALGPFPTSPSPFIPQNSLCIFFGKCLMTVSRRPGWVKLTTVICHTLQSSWYPWDQLNHEFS